MRIEYRTPTNEEMDFGELTTFIESAEYHFEDIIKDTIGSEFEGNFRGLRYEDYVLVAYDTDRNTFAGVVILENFRDKDEHFCNLNNLYVKSSYWREGIGSELVRRAISEARSAGKKVILTVLAKNEIGRKFWGKVGYLKPISTDYVVDYEAYDAEGKKC